MPDIDQLTSSSQPTSQRCRVLYRGPHCLSLSSPDNQDLTIARTDKKSRTRCRQEVGSSPREATLEVSEIQEMTIDPLTRCICTSLGQSAGTTLHVGEYRWVAVYQRPGADTYSATSAQYSPQPPLWVILSPDDIVKPTLHTDALLLIFSTSSQLLHTPPQPYLVSLPPLDSHITSRVVSRPTSSVYRWR